MTKDDHQRRIEAIVRSYFSAVNDSRWEDVVALFHEDARLHVPRQPLKVGHEQIRRFYTSHGRRFPEHYDDVPYVLVEGDTASALIDFRGVDVHGNLIKFWTADWWRIEGDRFKEMLVIFDTAQLDAPFDLGGEAAPPEPDPWGLRFRPHLANVKP